MLSVVVDPPLFGTGDISMHFDQERFDTCNYQVYALATATTAKSKLRFPLQYLKAGLANASLVNYHVSNFCGIGRAGYLAHDDTEYGLADKRQTINQPYRNVKRGLTGMRRTIVPYLA